MNIKILKIVMIIVAFAILESCCSFDHLDFQLYDPKADYSNQELIRFDGMYILRYPWGDLDYTAYQFYPNGLVLKSYSISSKDSLLNGEYTGEYGFYKITDDVVNIEVFGNCITIFIQFEYEIYADTLSQISGTTFHRGILGIGRIGHKRYFNRGYSAKYKFHKTDKIIPIPPYDKLKIKLSQPFYRDTTIKGN